MNVKEFTDKVAALTGGRTYEKITANGFAEHGVFVRTGNLAPWISVEDMYRKGLSPEEAAQKAEMLARDSMDIGLQQCDLMSIAQDYQAAKPYIRVRLLHKSTPAEVYRSAAMYGFEDLILVPYLQISDYASLKLTQVIMEAWKVSFEAVFQEALANMQQELFIQGLDEFLTSRPDLTKDHGPLDATPVILLSNNRTFYGAAYILVARELLDRMLPDGYYVVPSSVHELLILPKAGLDIKDTTGLNDFVKTMNSTYVSPQGILSDHIYDLSKNVQHEMAA